MIAPTVHRLRVEKFRRIQEPTELDLDAPRGEASRNVVLAGPNGCGKTSLLEALLLGLGQQALITRDLERRAREEHWRVTVPEGARIDIDVSLAGGPRQTWLRTADRHVVVGADGAESPLPEAAADLAVEYFSSWRAPELVGPVKPLVGPGRRPQDTETNRLWRLKQRIADARFTEGFGRRPRGRADAWLDRINAAWAKLHHDDGTRIVLDLDDYDSDEALTDLFVVRGDPAERVCSVDQVSSGEIELLSMAGWVVSSDFAGGLLVIDEPELHLHPEWQATILPALHDLAPEAQLVVASHSDAVWDQAFAFERFLLVPDSDPRSRAWRAGPRA